jgi:hypothetical protein
MGATSGDIEIVDAKLGRAKAHAADFVATWTEFVESGAYGVTFNMDPDSPHALHWRWKVRAQPANEWKVLTELGLIFGDVLTNLRATLDYLVWQLVLAARNSPGDEHAFPCVMLARDWASAKGRRLVGIDPAWVDEIEKLQPYHRTHKPERHLFAVLDYVNNVNKHRTLPAAIVTVPRFASRIESLDMPGRTLHWDNFLDRPIEDGVEFFRMLWDPPLDKLDVAPDSKLPLRVAFRDGLDHSDGWSYTNGDLVAWVESAVAVFRPAFPS